MYNSERGQVFLLQKETSVEPFYRDEDCNVICGYCQYHGWQLPFNMALGEVLKLYLAAYGLVEAAVEWCFSISSVLEEHGWCRLTSDPCCWILTDTALAKKKTRARRLHHGLNLPLLQKREDMLVTSCLCEREGNNGHTDWLKHLWSGTSPSQQSWRNMGCSVLVKPSSE